MGAMLLAQEGALMRVVTAFRRILAWDEAVLLSMRR